MQNLECGMQNWQGFLGIKKQRVAAPQGSFAPDLPRICPMDLFGGMGVMLSFYFDN